jgi:NAD(P)H dehydrogenase (quinone)
VVLKPAGRCHDNLKLHELATRSIARGALTGVAADRVAFVSRDEVAAAAAGILIGEGHAGAIYTATDSRTYTEAERAALISEITGKPFAFDIVTGNVERLAGRPPKALREVLSAALK